jgi:hypothetical protein
MATILDQKNLIKPWPTPANEHLPSCRAGLLDLARRQRAARRGVQATWRRSVRHIPPSPPIPRAMAMILARQTACGRLLPRENARFNPGRNKHASPSPCLAISGLRYDIVFWHCSRWLSPARTPVSGDCSPRRHNYCFTALTWLDLAGYLPPIIVGSLVLPIERVYTVPARYAPLQPTPVLKIKCAEGRANRNPLVGLAREIDKTKRFVSPARETAPRSSLARHAQALNPSAGMVADSEFRHSLRTRRRPLLRLGGDRAQGGKYRRNTLLPADVFSLEFRSIPAKHINRKKRAHHPRLPSVIEGGRMTDAAADQKPGGPPFRCMA